MVSFEGKIGHLKRCVGAMLAERAAYEGAETAAASPIWDEVLGVHRYLMNLAPEDFRNIRFHAGIVAGVIFNFWHPYPKPDPNQVAAHTRYADFVKDLPYEYWLGEPPEPQLPRPIGIEYRGRVINHNLARFQRTVSNLYFSGVIDHLFGGGGERRIVFEVGGGYGGLAHAMGNLAPGRIVCAVMDFPEMMLFQYPFLELKNPGRSIYLYDPETFDAERLASEIGGYDYVLLPNYILGRLDAFPPIDVFVNMQSFQEMSRAQIGEYLDFAARKTVACVYSDNLDRHPYNPETFSLSELLQERFQLFPAPAVYERMYQGQDPLSYHSYKQYIGRQPDNASGPPLRVERFFAGPHTLTRK